jgi:hypothetical protein
VNVPLTPGSWSEFSAWFSAPAIVCLTLVVVCAVLRYREWSEPRHERAEADRVQAEADAAEAKVLDRRSSRVRAVEAITGAIEIIAPTPLIAEAPESPTLEVVL